MFRIRTETAADRDSVREIHLAAFGREAEAELVDRLRRSPAFLPELSLLAEAEGTPVGHALFTRTELEPPAHALLLALGPLAVLPEWQRRGSGSLLVREGLARCRSAGAATVVVVGHPEYYPRFGFRPARELGLEPPFPLPDGVWMTVELAAGRMDGLRGVVRYAPEFSRS